MITAREAQILAFVALSAGVSARRFSTSETSPKASESGKEYAQIAAGVSELTNIFSLKLHIWNIVRAGY